jgi:hypothetical protein
LDDSPVKKVIVAVHGIGDQTRFATVKQAMSRFFHYHGEPADVPLGGFHSGSSLVLSSAYPEKLRELAFAEVYWADIARQVAEERYSLEEIKPWVRTVISRVRRQSAGARKVTAADQLMIEEVLGEMVQTIGVLDRLFFLAGKLGLFSFNLKKVLVDYVDDVQIVAEFKAESEEIGRRFAERLEAIHAEFPQAEIYLVAHSEGTVVALLGLLSALCAPEEHAWIGRVRGLMTFGSPIDKHLILWPELFAAFAAPRRKPEQPIEWRNYYDYGDPVGFELETARARFTGGAWADVFNFPAGHDHGFARYPLPGKAHNDYWQDADVFGHFIRTVVERDEPASSGPAKTSEPRPPASRPLARVVSWCAPYLGALALLFCGVLILHKAIHACLAPGWPEGLWQIIPGVASFTSLLAGVTVLARIPRLTRAKAWHLFGAVIFLLSLVGYRTLPCVDPTVRAGGLRRCVAASLSLHGQDLGLVGPAILLLLVVYLAGKRYPALGMWTLMVPAGIAVVVFLVLRITGSDSEPGNLWPVVLAGAFFLYVWWLVALLFDLTFVWHRYIRMAVRIFSRPTETRRTE